MIDKSPESQISNEDSEKEFIFFCDLNNQYGWAMSQYLPEKNFEWEEDYFSDKDIDLVRSKILDIKDDSSEGYFLRLTSNILRNFMICIMSFLYVQNK